MKSAFSYYRSSFIVTAVGLIFGAIIGFAYSHTFAGAMTALFLTAVLSILEISLSVDNAIVNARVLRSMTPLWRHRFLTWGMLIAVFGMRIVFPLLIVSVVAHVDPWAALVMATTRPNDYAAVMLSAHVSLAGFGGSFLLLVCLTFFFDGEKDIHWLRWIEVPVQRAGKIPAVSILLCALVLGIVSRFLSEGESTPFLWSSTAGVAAFIAIHTLSKFLHVPKGSQNDLHKASAAMFIYLEILDASFSFDGVIGAFALTHNLFIIAAGLGIGAMFVRSLTLQLVDHRALEQFRYLEHGAFYAIGVLALILFFGLFHAVPEAVTGLLGAVLIALALFSSLRYRRRQIRGKA